jgi:hypothetical protein
MKLQEFMSQTLKEIMGGIQEAQKHAESIGAKVNPALQPYQTESQKKALFVNWGADRGCGPVEQIEFDVAVSSTDTTEMQTVAGVFVAALGLGAKGTSDASNCSVSRIKFSVPIAFPLQSKKSTYE